MMTKKKKPGAGQAAGQKEEACPGPEHTTESAPGQEVKPFNFNQATTLDAAMAYADKQLPVFPCNPTDKTPLTKHGFKDATTDSVAIEKMWARHPGAAIGIPTGKESGLLVLDLDDYKANFDQAGWHNIRRKIGELPKTLTQRTGGGGRQYFFKHPGGTIKCRNGLITGLDIKASGGYVILPPSKHPSGGTYQWIKRSLPAPLPDGLLNLIHGENKAVEPTQKPLNGGTSRYAETALQGEINRVLSAPEGTRNDTLNRAAFALGQLVAGGELDHMTVEGELLTAAVASGLNQVEARKTIQSGMASGAASPRQAPEPSYTGDDFQATGAQDKPEPWEPIVPLESETAPPIDPEVLPGALRDMVVEDARATETPPELGGGMGLSVVATCCQGKIIIEPKPGYWEPLNIFTVTALDSANRKSGVSNIMTEPLRAAELDKRAKVEPFLKEMAVQQKNLESRLKSMRAKYGKAAPEELREIENEIQEMEKQVEPVPPLPRLWADDVTPEHLGTMMHQHNERMSILSAEGGIFDILAGRYSNGIPNMEVFLKGHACEPARVDRGSREPVFLDAPCLTIGLAPQPAVLRGLAGKSGFRGRGLLARFLYFLPASLLGYRALQTDPVPEPVKQAWGNLIARLLSINPRRDEHDRETPYIIKLSAEALNEWEDFSQAVEIEMRPGGRFEQITDWAGKLPGAAARIAGLFHCIENPGAPWAEKVGGATMNQALNLSAVYADHALVAFGLMGGDPGLEMAKKIWRWVETGRHRQFSKRDCFQALRGIFTRAKEIEEPMNILVERNYLRTKTVKTGGVKGGRPTEVVTVNPDIVRGWA